MTRWSILTWKAATRQAIFTTHLVEHSSREEFSQEHGGSRLALFRYPRAKSRFLGTMHVVKGDLPSVLHETSHLAARAAHIVNRVPLASHTDEAIARHLEGILPLVLEFYGFKIVPIAQEDTIARS